MIRIKHRFLCSGIFFAATPHSRHSFHEEHEHEMSFPGLPIVFLLHWMAKIFQRKYPDISGFIPDSDEKPGF